MEITGHPLEVGRVDDSAVVLARLRLAPVIFGQCQFELIDQLLFHSLGHHHVVRRQTGLATIQPFAPCQSTDSDRQIHARIDEYGAIKV